MARVTVQGKTASNSLVDLLVEEDGSLAASSGASAAAIGAAVNTLPALVTNQSGTIAGAGGTATIAANATRQLGFVQHTGTAGLMRVAENATASSTLGYKLGPGDSCPIISTAAVSLWAELAGTTYAAFEAS